MRLKEQRGRDSLFFVFFFVFFPKEGKRERERESATCGEITSDFTQHLLRKMTKEEPAAAKEIAVEKKKNDSKKEEQPEGEEEEEEEETCGFCAYMKGGSCKQEFVCWEKCVDAAKANEEDFVAKCFEETTALRECMMKDPGYYGEMDDDGGGNDDDDDDDDKRKRSENNKSSSESSRKDRSSEKEQKR